MRGFWEGEVRFWGRQGGLRKEMVPETAANVCQGAHFWCDFWENSGVLGFLQCEMVGHKGIFGVIIVHFCAFFGAGFRAGIVSVPGGAGEKGRIQGRFGHSCFFLFLDSNSVGEGKHS